MHLYCFWKINIIDSRKPQNWLLALIIINIISTILHYTDNFIFFDRYPAPSWMNMHHVYVAWLLLFPFAVIGYILYTKQNYWLAYLCLFIYSNTGAASMGQRYVLANERFDRFRYNYRNFPGFIPALVGFYCWGMA